MLFSIWWWAIKCYLLFIAFTYHLNLLKIWRKATIKNKIEILSCISVIENRVLELISKKDISKGVSPERTTKRVNNVRIRVGLFCGWRICFSAFLYQFRCTHTWYSVAPKKPIEVHTWTVFHCVRFSIHTIDSLPFLSKW